MPKPLSFQKVAMVEGNPKYEQAISRLYPFYQRKNDIREPFERDYTRILFSKAYRRLKHKTQVFFAVSNDHVCTRLEHVALVQSVSETIAGYLGLNTTLTRAIAAGHDLGHAPFGHGGEKILAQLYEKYQLGRFFHERNSLYFVDKIEQLKDDNQENQPLNLCYAVRDGIISHCGEVHLEAIKPREEAFDLENYNAPGLYAPFTYEGCVVKMADKIAYLSRDIEDALELGLLTKADIRQLEKELSDIDPLVSGIDNGTLIHYFIQDVCQHSTIEKGIALSKQAYLVMQKVMAYNYENIYLTKRLKVFDDYVALMIHSLFDVLKDTWQKDGKLDKLEALKARYPNLAEYFMDWLLYYTSTKLYNPSLQQDYIRAILDYISGMTDTFMLKTFNELVTF
jgi:dGTP triphosphohydrolase